MECDDAVNSLAPPYHFSHYLSLSLSPSPPLPLSLSLSLSLSLPPCIHTAPRVTSITIDGSRFLTTAETRTLTCNYQPSTASVSWRRNNNPVPDAPDSVISNSPPGQSTLRISVFDQQVGNTVDLFECVVNNSLGGVVSEAIGLVEVQTAGSGTDMPGRETWRERVLCVY